MQRFFSLVAGTEPHGRCNYLISVALLNLYLRIYMLDFVVVVCFLSVVKAPCRMLQIAVNTESMYLRAR